MEPKLERLLHGLRLFGAAMVATAAGTFLVQSWDEVGDVTRYLGLLGMTLSLPAVAYLCGVRLREDRSARVLLITLLALIPVHAGVLAGFFFSQFGGAHPSVVSAAQWVAPSPIAAVGVVLGAGAVLVPLIWTAYRALHREHARLLTTASVGLHGLLLVPSRSALTATLLVGPMIAGASWCTVRAAPKTREAKIAVASLLGPIVLLLSRQIFFYDAGTAFWAMVLGVVAAGLFVLGQRLDDNTLRRFSALPTLLSTGFFWFTMVEQLSERLDFALAPGLAVLAYGWLSMLPLGVAAWRSPPTRAFFVWTFAVLNACLVTLVMLLQPSPWVAFEAIAVGLAVASYGYLRQRAVALYVGVALVVPGIAIEIHEAIERFEPSGWLALAGFGVTLVGVTAWLERRTRSMPRSEPQ